MEAIKLSLYEKDIKTGIVENIVGSYPIEQYIELIDKAYAIKEDELLKVHLYLTVEGEIEDWEYDAIFDNYSGEAFNDIEADIEEVEDSHNPTWLFTFNFIDSSNEMQDKINEILSIHSQEIEKIAMKIKNTDK